MQNIKHKIEELNTPQYYFYLVPSDVHLLLKPFCRETRLTLQGLSHALPVLKETATNDTNGQQDLEAYSERTSQVFSLRGQRVTQNYYKAKTYV